MSIVPTSASVPRSDGYRSDPSAPAVLDVLYEHPTWFGPLFEELARRKIPFHRRTPEALSFSVAAAQRGRRPRDSQPHGEPRVLFNRMSPSAYLRDGASGIRFTLHLLEELEARGVQVVNGSRAYRTEISKLRQLRLLGQVGVRAPETHTAHTPEGVREAARGLAFPLVLKPNVGGSGAGVVRVDSPAELEAGLEAVRGESDALSVDPTLLVQEYVPPAENAIVRVEVVGGRFLYAIRIHLSGDTFNLCPADVCRSVDGEELSRSACPTDAPKSGLRVESHRPPDAAIREVESIMGAAGIDVGGAEYLVHGDTGERVYYDVNALSNFVADPLRVLGFDPTERLVDWLEEVLA